MNDILILNSVVDESLVTSILISLFSDKRADEDEAPKDDRRGYWGDDDLGSKLWLLDRGKQTNTILVKAEQYATESLAWLVEDGYLDEISITARFEDSNLIILIEPIGLEIDYTAKTII